MKTRVRKLKNKEFVAERQLDYFGITIPGIWISCHMVGGHPDYIMAERYSTEEEAINAALDWLSSYKKEQSNKNTLIFDENDVVQLENKELDIVSLKEKKKSNNNLPFSGEIF